MMFIIKYSTNIIDISCTKSHEKFLKHYRIHLEMVRSVSSSFIYFAFLMQNFNARCDAFTA